MERTLKAAVIGAGNMGRHHLRIYSELPNVELVAAVDPDLATCATIEARYNIPTYQRYEDLLNKHDLDVVSVTVPTVHHYEVALATLNHGIATLVEKPIAATSTQGSALIEVARRYGVPFMVGHVERFNPAVVELKRQLDAGVLGQVFQIHVRRIGPFPERIKDVGVVVDLATHDLDIMHYLAESQVLRLHAEIGRKIHTNHEDLLAAVLRFENKIIGMLDISWLSPNKLRELTVIGKRGMFVVNYITQELFLYENEFVNRAGWEELAQFGVSEGRMIRFNIPKREPLREELRAFVDAVAAGTAVPVAVEDALHALAIAEALASSDNHNGTSEFCSEAWRPRAILRESMA